MSMLSFIITPRVVCLYNSVVTIQDGATTSADDRLLVIGIVLCYL